MMGFIEDQISSGDFIRVFFILLIIAYFIYKEGPEFHKRMVARRMKDQTYEQADKDLERRVARLESKIDEHQVMLSRDYKELHALKDSTEISRQVNMRALEEMEVIMRTNLAVLDSLEELGASKEVTQNARRDINSYLTKTAHTSPQQFYWKETDNE